MIERWFAVEIDRHSGGEYLDITRDLFANYDLTSFIRPNYDNGITTYFHKTSRIDYPGLDSFYQYIINCATNLAVHQGMDPLMYKLELTHIWVNRLFTNGYHGRHSHGRSHYSGTYYVNSPTEASRIRFYHPFSDLVQHDFPKVSKIGTSLLSEYVDYDPTPGTMLVWNSWLYHEVLPNKSAEPRDSISFNLSCVPNA
jgi:uncharacterized protein (TIGR02466 family)